MNRLRQFWQAADQVFDLPRRLRAVRDGRIDPSISAGVLTTSLFLGAVLRVLQLPAETGRPGWRRLTGRSKPISDDTFGYGLERARWGDWRDLLVVVNQTLKGNKAFAAAKIHGLLVVALDANEQFKSRSRCCAACCQRQVKVTDPAGQVVEVTE